MPFLLPQNVRRFAEYLETSNLLPEQASKKEVADTAPVFAFHLGYYRTRFGHILTTEPMGLLTTEKIIYEIAVTLVGGLEALIEALEELASLAG